jgi:hypothetical protein
MANTFPTRPLWAGEVVGGGDLPTPALQTNQTAIHHFIVKHLEDRNPELGSL